MRISHLTSNITGGAGLASMRLHEALLDHGLNSKLLISEKNNSNLNLYKSIRNIDITDISLSNEDLEGFYSYYTKQNCHKSFVGFSLPKLRNSFDALNMILEQSDVINLHWIANFLSLGDIAYLSHQEKPLVWTVHDKNVFSGGCHYFHECENWMRECENCPQLKNNLDNLPARVFKLKKNFFNFDNLTLVVLNEHFKELALKSKLYRNTRVKVIANSIDTDKFNEIGRNTQKFKKKHGISQQKKLIFYVSAYKSIIKGYREFCETIMKLKNPEKYHIILAGNVERKVNFGTSYVALDYLNEEELIEVYKNVDVTVLSSIEDNLPNICLESLACGTPVVGFKVGGIPDLVKDGITGYTVSLGDCVALASTIEKVCLAQEMRSKAREFAVDNLRPEIQATSYAHLYEELLVSSTKMRSREGFESESFVRNFNKDMAEIKTSIYEAMIKWQTAKLKEVERQTNSLIFILKSLLIKLFFIKKIYCISIKILKYMLPPNIYKRLQSKFNRL